MASKMREMLEDQREILYEKLKRARFELEKIEDSTLSDYQWKSSECRKMVNGLNALTEKINEIKELDSDPEVCEQLDQKFRELYPEQEVKSEEDKIKDEIDKMLGGLE